MQPILERLLRQAADRSDWDRQADAIRQLWYLLRVKNRPHGTDYYVEHLSDDLRSLKLQEGEEQALVNELETLIISAQSDRERGSLFAPLHYASPRYAIQPVLRLLMRWKDQGWTHDDAWSIMYALERALDVMGASDDDFRSHAPYVAAAIHENDPRPKLNELATVPDDRVAEMAQDVGSEVEAVFEPPARTWLARLRSLTRRT
jgi:hypothetical protein